VGTNERGGQDRVGKKKAGEKYGGKGGNKYRQPSLSANGRTELRKGK